MIHLEEISAKNSDFSYYITESAKKLDESSIINKTYVDKNRVGVTDATRLRYTQIGLTLRGD